MEKKIHLNKRAKKKEIKEKKKEAIKKANTKINK